MADGTARWYVVHTYTGYENKVAENLAKLVKNRELQDRIFEVKIPTEKVLEIRNGKPHEYERKLFPGYVLVKMIVDKETWYIIRNTDGVTGFVGTPTDPTPLTQAEVDKLGVDKTEVEVKYSIGDSVQIVAGELEGFIGRVENIDRDNQRVTVKVSMFGRDTSAEMKLTEVSPLEN